MNKNSVNNHQNKLMETIQYLYSVVHNSKQPVQIAVYNQQISGYFHNDFQKEILQLFNLSLSLHTFPSIGFFQPPIQTLKKYTATHKEI